MFTSSAASLELLSVQTAKAEALQISGHRVMTAIRKQAVSTPQTPQRVAVRPLGLVGDEQADPSVHGGLSKAVYAYPSEHYPFWETVRAQARAGNEHLPYGFLGENLTLRGLLESEVFIGDVLRFPHCTLTISEPRQPCFKFQHIMGFNQATKLMAQSGFCGFYLAVHSPGSLAAGEKFEFIPGPRQVSVLELFNIKMRRRDD